MPKLSRYLGSRNETNVSLIDRNVAESGHGVRAIQSRKEIPRSEQVRHDRGSYSNDDISIMSFNTYRKTERPEVEWMMTLD